MSIESLKQKARKAEQNEDWRKALEHYDKALTELAREEQVDIGLYNRVGDLYVRVNRLDQAVDHYQKAVELYREAYLPNNAIAVCKKIIRNVPDHHEAYLVIGQIRAEQGFIPDARTNFLTYAERMQQAGDLDESFRALVEFCDLAPDDVGVRMTVAEQMAAQERTEEAVEQLLIVYQHYKGIGESEKASEIEGRILELDPDADLTAMPAVGGYASSDDDAGFGQFGEISLGADAFAGGDSEDEADFAVSSAMEEAASEVLKDEDTEEMGAGEAAEPEGFDISASDEGDDEPAELPTMDFDDDDDVEEAPELPMMDFGDDEGEEDEAELPTLGGDDPKDEGVVTTTDTEDFSLEDTDVTAESDIAGAMEEAVEEARSEEPEIIPPSPEPVADPETTEAPAGPTPPPPTQEKEAPPPQEKEAPPPQKEPAPKPGGDDSFVDLGAMILGDDRDEKTTRFTVAYQEPSGDEEADFAKMLSQFKDKVSENLDSSDVRAHYDLGTAYKEMGLLDEAITSFQAALRASAHHLPTYELMGQTFMEMGQPEAAVRSLERALQSPRAVEDELVGIYYYLGRAYEELENKESAVDYYDRVFALDINFADVTERLRELR